MFPLLPTNCKRNEIQVGHDGPVSLTWTFLYLFVFIGMNRSFQKFSAVVYSLLTYVFYDFVSVVFISLSK